MRSLRGWGIVALASLSAALFANELILDLQLGPQEGRSLECREPTQFWGYFERCRGIEEHMFWVAGVSALAAIVATSLLMRRRPIARPLGPVLVAGVLAFAGVLGWGYLFEMSPLPDNV